MPASRLIRSLGYDVYPRAKKRIDGSPPWVVAMVLWFMSRIRSFRELLATGQAECCALVDTMVSAAPLGRSPVVVSDIQAMSRPDRLSTPNSTVLYGRPPLGK
jgi:2-dehydropantoate 2-reductase